MTQPVPPAEHTYLSTACRHGRHNPCRQQCKFCYAQCVCTCHKGWAMTDQAPEHVADPSRERLVDPVELGRPPAELSRSTRILIYTAALLGLALAVGVFWWVLTEMWALP